RQHIEYAASLNLDAVQLSIPDDFESVEAGHLHEVRDYAAAKSIELSVGTGCICPTNPAWNPAHGSPEQYLVGSGTVGTGCLLELNGSKVTDELWLREGDEVVMEVEGLGRLVNTVVRGAGIPLPETLVARGPRPSNPGAT
ncbi:MAG: hypothetical protein ABSE74_02500, partial [Methanoregula sp.]